MVRSTRVLAFVLGICSILNSDCFAEAFFQSESSGVVESTKELKVRVLIDPPDERDRTLGVRVSPASTLSDEEYVFKEEHHRIPAGTRSLDLKVGFKDDELPEESEDFIIELFHPKHLYDMPNKRLRIGYPQRFYIRVYDDDHRK